MLALKYLLRYRRRYLFLITALTAGFAIVTVIISQKDGMSANVYASAQSHYAGDIVFSGHDMDSERRSRLDFGTISAIVKAIDDADSGYSHIVKRTLLLNSERLFFNGATVQLKYTVGLDGDTEADYLNALPWTGGGHDPLDDETIYISAPIASMLGAVRGDSLVLETVTRYNRKNSGVFVIGGIINDSTIFGFYKVYLSRTALNRLVEFEDEDCSSVGVYLAKHGRAAAALIDDARTAIYQQLRTMVDVSALVYDRDDWEDEKSKDWSGIRVFPLTLNVYLSEVSQILEALNLLAYLLYVIMLLIIFVSAVVTYRLILHERTREIGTMRAIGFHGHHIRILLLLETVFLATVSIIAGLLLAALVNLLLSGLSFSWLPSFEIFMKNGRLSPSYLVTSLAINSFSLYIVLILAVWLPAFGASRQALPAMLAASAKG